jgi:short-subunit dehydrogenase
MRLAGARVLVTGASRGIGEALARELAGRGAQVALVARSEGPLKELAAALDGVAYPTDLTDPEQVNDLIARVEADGPLDVVVNNAGIDEVGWFPEVEPDRLAAIVQVNLVAPMSLCRQVIPRMLERGHGHIVNVSSLAGIGVFPGLVQYSATKAGLTQFTAGLRADLKGLPVSTTLVELGPVPTEMTAGFDVYTPTVRSFSRFDRIKLLADVPRERVAEDVADAIEKKRKHVRHPKRAILFPLTAELPRHIVEVVLKGVPHRQERR